ncbi:MAG: hydrogenase accessory protein HypB, partial [Desulfobulbaceae bacterium]
MCDSCGCDLTDSHSHDSNSRIIEVHQSLLAANDAIAAENKAHFEAMGAVAINMISSPGSGKTTLLEKTIERLKGKIRIGVIEGDIET